MEDGARSDERVGLLGGIGFGFGLNPVDLGKVMEALLALFNHLFGKIDGIDWGRWIECGKLFGKQTSSGTDIENAMGCHCGCLFEQFSNQFELGGCVLIVG